MSYRRLFIGIPVTGPVVDEILLLQEEWQRKFQLPPESRVLPADFHVTLHFLGKVPEVQIPIWEKELGAIRLASPFSFQFNRCLPFPSALQARVVTLGGGSGDSPMNQLHHGLSASVNALGYSLEKRVFTPHITLFRGKGFILPRELEVKSSITLQVSSFALFESHLTPLKKRYEILKEFSIVK
ncbi:RNA 2',3'-cyclic phosphodiesterase [bacterium]|nr:RNA 2',3'-cyclic phosphodiesterase [bacterium]